MQYVIVIKECITKLHSLIGIGVNAFTNIMGKLLEESAPGGKYLLEREFCGIAASLGKYLSKFRSRRKISIKKYFVSYS